MTYTSLFILCMVTNMGHRQSISYVFKYDESRELAELTICSLWGQTEGKLHTVQNEEGCVPFKSIPHIILFPSPHAGYLS